MTFPNDEIARQIATELEKEFGYVNDNYPGFIGVMETKIAVALSAKDTQRKEAVEAVVRAVEEASERRGRGLDYPEAMEAMLVAAHSALDMRRTKV